MNILFTPSILTALLLLLLVKLWNFNQKEKGRGEKGKLRQMTPNDEGRTCSVGRLNGCVQRKERKKERKGRKKKEFSQIFSLSLFLSLVYYIVHPFPFIVFLNYPRQARHTGFKNSLRWRDDARVDRKDGAKKGRRRRAGRRHDGGNTTRWNTVEYKQGFKFIFDTASFWFWYQGGIEFLSP